MNKSIIKLLSSFDLSQIFKTKGDLKRWSAKRTIGGIIVLTACSKMANCDVTWQLVCLCLIGVLPLCISLFEKK